MEGAPEREEITLSDGLNTDFIALTRLLDAELAQTYGALQKQYDRYNSTEALRRAAVAYVGGKPVGCGAFKEYGGGAVEIKRMFVAAQYRRRGLAGQILARLEREAKADGYKAVVLETGARQLAAIALYKGMGYAVTENYGQYAGNPNSVCMKKELT